MGGVTLEDTVRAIAAMLIADEPFPDILHRIARMACDVSPRASAVELTLVDERGRPTEAVREGGNGNGPLGDHLSAPLVAGSATLGTLTLHADRRTSFTEADAAGIEVFAAQAAVVLANARAYWDVHEMASGLEAAMQSRAVIEQAKGRLMTIQGCTADEAFTVLARTSQRDNLKLRALARRIMDGTYDRELARP